MIPPMVTARTVIVVVPLTILVRGHEVDATRADLRHATYTYDLATTLVRMQAGGCLTTKKGA
jgi:hypothetical protein